MNSGAKLSMQIAAGLALAAFFPLLGLLAGAVIFGMALNSHLNHKPTPKVGDVQCDKQLLEELTNEEFLDDHATSQRRVRRGRSRSD